MRRKRNLQDEFDFQPSNLKVTNDYFQRYAAIDRILRETPAILDWVHRDLRKALAGERTRNRKFHYTSEHVLRLLICQTLEGESQRGIVVRVDDSPRLRRFVRIGNGRMMNYSTYCNLKNFIRPKTWRKINEALVKSAVEAERFSGEELRLDTTAVEANIHYPTDSSLLADVYRVMARGIARAREIDPKAVGEQRLQERTVKRHAASIARKVAKKGARTDAVKGRYQALFELVARVLAWAAEVRVALREGLARNAYSFEDALRAEAIALDLEEYHPLGQRVLDQAHRRVLHGEVVPATEKIYSIFEPHTELLKRGKVGKPIEFGHMVLLQQTRDKLITGYEVFLRRPEEPELLAPALDDHRALFGADPEVLAADKGFWNGAKVAKLEERIPTVSICKMGKRNEKETAREAGSAFKLGQRFRAGIEGTISFFKRAFRLLRCLNKGWTHYQATVGATVFVHNLVVLARGYG
ncbi:MAG: ISNCY family transposase [Planctomycetota bacterium]